MEDGIQPDQLPFEYWNRDNDGRTQYYYLALCLMVASLQDALLGQVERRNRNLNWSATVSYYSLVHSGRLIAFATLGDYPTQHASLRRLFNGEQVRLDWLSAHARFAGRPNQPASEGSRGEILAQLDELGVAEAYPRVVRFGEMLS